MAAMDAFPQPPIVDVIRGPEIEELLITKEDMLAVSVTFCNMLNISTQVLIN